jgi:tetratricopeptide (TPR) repeat protein
MGVMATSAENLINESIGHRKLRNFDAALASALAAVQAAPQNANAWWQASLNHWALNDTGAAEVALRKTVELAPTYEEGWELLGKVLLKKGNDIEALDTLNKVIELDP